MGLVLHVRARNSRRAAAASAPLSVLFNGGENASLLVRHCGGRTTTQGRERRPERGRARPPRDSRLRLAPCFLLCSLTFSRCLAHRGAADLALFATVLTALRPCEGSLLPALLFSSARGVQGCPPVLRAPSFVASLVAAACRHRAGSQRRARGDDLVRAAEGPSV